MTSIMNMSTFIDGKTPWKPHSPNVRCSVIAIISSPKSLLPPGPEELRTCRVSRQDRPLQSLMMYICCFRSKLFRFAPSSRNLTIRPQIILHVITNNNFSAVADRWLPQSNSPISRCVVAMIVNTYRVTCSLATPMFTITFNSHP